MTSAENRIKELARAKNLDEGDAARLLEAVRPPISAPAESALRNPFARFSGEVTSATGVVVAAVGVLASRFGMRFDGALDAHSSQSVIPLRVALIDQLVAFPLTALALWLVARAVVRHVRLVDMLGTVGLARAPVVVLALPLGIVGSVVGDPNRMTPALAVLIAGALAGFGAQIYLLLVGFRTASGLRGGRLAAFFIGSIVLAEIVGKIVLAIAT